MSYENGTYNGEIYLGNVKWSNDYKHVMDFGSKSNRTNFLKNHLTLQNGISEVTGGISAISSLNSYIEVNRKVKNVENVNYMLIKFDSDFSDTYFCCFVTNFEIMAENVTRLFIELDIFQQYFYDASFYKSILERAHISKSEDNSNWSKYTTPEPLGAASEIDVNVAAFSDIDFTPILTFDAISKPDTPAGSTQLQYYYGGNGTNAQNMTGYFRFKAPTDSDILSAVLYFWSMAETSQSTITHMSDLIGFNFIPNWVSKAASWKAYGNLPGDPVKELKNNNLYSVSDTVSLNRTNSSGKRILACGYEPTNKKLFTNLCRAYKLWNKNGLSIPIAPNQLSNQNSLTITIRQRPMGATYKVELINYKDVATRFFDLQYSYSIAFGINNNVGTAQQTALAALDNQQAVLKANQKETAFNTATGVINSVLSTTGAGVANAFAGNIEGAIQNFIQLGTSAYSSGLKLDRITAEMSRDNFNMQTAYNNAVSSISASMGNNSDRTTMTNDFCRLRIAECSPTTENCRIIDDFLTVYGYSIQEIKSPSSYLRTRPLFNYIKTSNCNLNIPAPNSYEKILKSIFDSGVTLWHYSYNNNNGYSAFGNYDLNNF